LPAFTFSLLRRHSFAIITPDAATPNIHTPMPFRFSLMPLADYAIDIFAYADIFFSADIIEIIIFRADISPPPTPPRRFLAHFRYSFATACFRHSDAGATPIIELPPAAAAADTPVLPPRRFFFTPAFAIVFSSTLLMPPFQLPAAFSLLRHPLRLHAAATRYLALIRFFTPPRLRATPPSAFHIYAISPLRRLPRRRRHY
jgi:hypothetical protein